MSREIKFRAWDKYDMSYDVERSSDDYHGCSYPYNFADYLEDDDYQLMQYIGLKDKNNKEIYEGDIVKIDGFDDDELNEHFLVKFENESARYILSGNRLVYDFDNTYANECEIIGNIYDNPELLEGDK